MAVRPEKICLVKSRITGISPSVFARWLPCPKIDFRVFGGCRNSAKNKNSENFCVRIIGMIFGERDSKISE
jgi:hypothetical protein